MLAALVLALAALLAPGPAAQDGDVERQVEEAARAEATEILSEDAQLAARARAVLDAVDDFRDMRAEVRGGIVVLSGAAASGEAVTRATGILGKLDGVLLVVDDVAIERGLGRRVHGSWREVGDQLRGIVAALPLYLAALGIVVLFYVLARLLRGADFLYRLWSERTLLQELLRQTVYVVVIGVGLVVALLFVDAGGVIGAILGAAGVLGIALGFAFRNIIENYLAGVLLAVRQPFRARDVVDIDGQVGTVLRTTSSETTLMDADGNHVRLPNAMIFNGKVVNYTRNPLRRFTVSVDVGNDVDLDAAQDLGVATLDRMKGVIDDPAPSGRVAKLGESTVLIELYGWVDQRAAGYAKVASEAHRLIKQAFDEAGIDMPPPTYGLTFEAPPPQVPAARRESATPEPPPGGPAPEQLDVSPETDIDEQVDEELASSDEKNLLEDS